MESSWSGVKWNSGLDCPPARQPLREGQDGFRLRPPSKAVVPRAAGVCKPRVGAAFESSLSQPVRLRELRSHYLAEFWRAPEVIALTATGLRGRRQCRSWTAIEAPPQAIDLGVRWRHDVCRPGPCVLHRAAAGAPAGLPTWSALNGPLVARARADGCGAGRAMRACAALTGSLPIAGDPATGQRLQRPPVRRLGRPAGRRPGAAAGRARFGRRPAGTAVQGQRPHALLPHGRRPRGAALQHPRIPVLRGDCTGWAFPPPAR